MPEQAEQAGGQQHAGEVENHVVGVEAAAHHRLDQLDGQDQHQARPQGVPPARVVPGEGVEEPEGQVHEDVPQVFPGKAGEEIGDQVEGTAEPAVDAAAGLAVEEEVPEVPDGLAEEGQAQEPREVGGKEGGPELPGDGRGPVPGKAADAPEEPRQQGRGQHLEEVADVGVEEEVLGGHGGPPWEEVAPMIPQKAEGPIKVSLMIL